MSASKSDRGALGAASLKGLGKDALLRDFSKLVSEDRHNTAAIVAYVGEIDRRKLYLEDAYPSMFAFCTRRLRRSFALR